MGSPQALTIMHLRKVWLIGFASFSCSVAIALTLNSLTPFQGPIQSVSLAKTPSQTGFEVVAELSQGPGNLTVTPDGQIILSLHQFYQPDYSVVAIAENGQITPFPNEAWSKGDTDPVLRLDSVLGLQSDPQGIVWLLDNGMKTGVTPKLVAWNSRRDQLERIIYLPAPVTHSNSFVNDLAVDLTHQSIYIADTARGGTPALIVVDLNTGLARRVLDSHPSVMPEDTDMSVEGQPILIKQPDGQFSQPRIGVNPIALDHNNEWVYYGPMSGTRLYRIRTTDLLDQSLSEEQLANRVENYGTRPNSDGISIDRDNNIYISDFGNNAIGVVRPDGRYQPLVRDPLISWPDAFSFGPDGYLYIVANQLHRSAPLNRGKDASEPPFVILRMKPLAEGIVGR